MQNISDIIILHILHFLVTQSIIIFHLSSSITSVFHFGRLDIMVTKGNAMSFWCNYFYSILLFYS